MDKLTALKAFTTVVSEGSFVAAAERLGMSRTAVSKHVMDLEAHLGARLLTRTTRRLSLTETGSGYFERARRILGDLEEADAEASELTVNPRGHLRINAPMSFGIAHIAPNLNTYLDRFPDVTVDLSLNDRVVDLVEEGFDLAIRIADLEDSSLIARRIGHTRSVLCASPEYLERHGMPGKPGDLTGHACLTYSNLSAPNSWVFRQAGQEIRVNVPSRLLCNNGDALAAAAVSGLGIIAQPAFIVGPALKAGELVELLPGHDPGGLGIYAVYATNRHLPARVRTFIDHLAACFAGKDL
ncbi:MAG: LysR family transcriptional regulator [Pseudomonadota bacterium]